MPLTDIQNSWPEGVKKTRQRESVLAILASSNTPLSAMDICSQIENSKECSAWLSTVYRILELFVKKGIASKINLINNDMAVYALNRFTRRHYAVCVDCKSTTAMDACPVQEFISGLEKTDFHVIGYTLEVYGYCKDCHSEEESSSNIFSKGDF